MTLKVQRRAAAGRLFWLAGIEGLPISHLLRKMQFLRALRVRHNACSHEGAKTQNPADSNSNP